MAKHKKIENCRICGNSNLEYVLDLGNQMLTGVFPKFIDNSVTSGPLQLVKCMGDEACGLLQMGYSSDDLGEMYGENYGYRSGLNASMVKHLQNKVKRILGQVQLQEGDLIVDIGSNDSTTLQAYPSNNLLLVGIDPAGAKFNSFYPSHIHLIQDFFSSELLKERFPNKKAKVVTSFAMFYDLESPLVFMQEVYDILADDGIWVFEQSYMPTMLEKNSYDTVCHEHLEFYALRQIKWMADRVGFKILDVEFNDINGGSFSVMVAKLLNGDLAVTPSLITSILSDEIAKGLDTLTPYQEFAKRVKKSKNDLITFINEVKTSGKKVAALGASTKGNVILQYCEFTENEISFVGEVNQEKYGCYTPGTWLPIIPETELIAKNINYLVVLPWHFRFFFENNSKFKGMTLVFPLPKLEVVTIGY